MLNFLVDHISRRLSHERLAAVYRLTPPSWSQGVALHRFRQTVRYAAKHSPYYRRVFGERGIDASKIRRPEDLGDFFTTPDDVVEHSTEFICRPPNIVFESSGTSGKN